jgi:hypothetical protein
MTGSRSLDCNVAAAPGLSDKQLRSLNLSTYILHRCVLAGRLCATHIAKVFASRVLSSGSGPRVGRVALAGSMLKSRQAEATERIKRVLSKLAYTQLGIAEPTAWYLCVLRTPGNGRSEPRRSGAPEDTGGLATACRRGSKRT